MDGRNRLLKSCDHKLHVVLPLHYSRSTTLPLYLLARGAFPAAAPTVQSCHTIGAAVVAETATTDTAATATPGTGALLATDTGPPVVALATPPLVVMTPQAMADLVGSLGIRRG